MAVIPEGSEHCTWEAVAQQGQLKKPLQVRKDTSHVRQRDTQQIQL